LIVGGVLVGVLVLVVILSSLGGGGHAQKDRAGAQGSGESTTTTSTSSTARPGGKSTTHSGSGSSVASDPANTPVAVLNGTSTSGLAHHLSGNLQQSGYTQATALNARPPGSHVSTVVEYASGHRLDAQHVAQTLGVTQVQPLDAATAPLAGSSTVVVIAGTDKAALVGASGATGATTGAGQ
jgi:hypothetical protein